MNHHEQVFRRRTVLKSAGIVGFGSIVAGTAKAGRDIQANDMIVGPDHTLRMPFDFTILGTIDEPPHSCHGKQPTPERMQVGLTYEDGSRHTGWIRLYAADRIEEDTEYELVSSEKCSNPDADWWMARFKQI